MAKSNLCWESSPAEKYAERWWGQRGYNVQLLRRYQSKSIYEVRKDGLMLTVEIPYTVRKFKPFMEQFQKGWDMHAEVVRLRQQLADRQ